MTAHFLTPLRTETIGERRWLLIDDLIFYSARFQGYVVAPRGFQTDLASIPRALWVLIPKVGKHDKPAVIHDAAYGNALLTRHGERIFCTQYVSDQLFLEGLRVERVPLAILMYAMVRQFGDPIGHPLRAATVRHMEMLRTAGSH